MGVSLPVKNTPPRRSAVKEYLGDIVLRLKPPRPQSNHHAVMLSCVILAYNNQNRLANVKFGLKSFVFPAGTEAATSLTLEPLKISCSAFGD